jgi:hypothetical protein
MLSALFLLYFLGGIASLILLITQYLRFSARHERRMPWSFFLGSGLAMFAVGVGMNIWARYTPQETYLGQVPDWVFGLWKLSFVVFIIGAIRCLHAITSATRKVLIMDDKEEVEGVWPPPPRPKM